MAFPRADPEIHAVFHVFIVVKKTIAHLHVELVVGVSVEGGWQITRQIADHASFQAVSFQVAYDRNTVQKPNK